MINVNELEDRWIKYKIKSYMPHAVIAVSSILIIIIIFTVINSSSSNEKKQIHAIKQVDTQQIKKIAPIKQITIAEIIEKPIEQNIVYKQKQELMKVIKKEPAYINNEYNNKTDSQQLKLSPSLGFMRKMQNDSLPYYGNDRESDTDTSNTDTYSQNDETTYEEDIYEEDTKKQSNQALISREPPATPSVNIVRQNTYDDINHVIKRFKKNNNPALSLFAAKKFYEIGEYHKAYNYALMTNEINNEIEASWIIFSKSLVKLNEKEMAIKTLKQYIEHSDSNRARILLEEIISGKFK